MNMSKYECIVCGLIYDEKEGWPDDGIAPGTRWADVPEDWLCPDCGVGKEDFELLEEAPVDDTPHHEEPVVDKVHSPVVILGTGLAGYGLAKEFRKHDDSTPLILITSDDGRSYSKPMLSTGYTKNHSANDLAQLDAGFRQHLPQTRHGGLKGFASGVAAGQKLSRRLFGRDGQGDLDPSQVGRRENQLGLAFPAPGKQHHPLPDLVGETAAVGRCRDERGGCRCTGRR